MGLDPAALKKKREAMAQVASSQVYADRGDDNPPPPLTVVDTGRAESPHSSAAQPTHTPTEKQPAARQTPPPSVEGVRESTSTPQEDLPQQTDHENPTPESVTELKRPRRTPTPPAARKAQAPTTTRPSTPAAGEGVDDITDMLNRLRQVHPTGNAAGLPTLRVPLPEDLYEDLMAFTDAIADTYHSKVRWQSLISVLMSHLPQQLPEHVPSSPTSRQSWQLTGRLLPGEKAALEKLGRQTRPRTSSTAIIQHQLRMFLDSWRPRLLPDED